MKKKFIYILCAVAIIASLSFAASKIFLPNAVSETAASSAASTVEVTKPTLTQLITEALTQAVSVSKSTTKKLESTAAQTQTTAAAETQTSTKAETAKVPDTTFFNIQIPTLPLPDFRPETTTEVKPSTTAAQVDCSCFDNCVFVGNSRFISLKNYGLAKNVYSVVGLNVDTVFTKSVSGSSVPVIDELNGKSYEKIFLMFGDNECGWPNQNVFIQRYSKVIAAVRERIPDAEIYLHAILPVSAEASESSQFGCNNPNINELNKKIKQLAADEGVNFIDQPACLKDANGALYPEAASDGIHLNKTYSKKWLNSLANEIYG